MANWLQRMESYIGGGSGGPRRVKLFRWLVLIGLLGAAMLLAASMMNMKTIDPGQLPEWSPPKEENIPQQEAFAGKEASQDPFGEIEGEFETRLKEVLESIVGVGTVQVLVTVDSTEETVVQLNEKYAQQLTDETDRNGAKRHITEVTRDGQVVLYQVSSGNQAPIVIKKIKPKIRGVIVVAKGAEHATVHKLIAEAISRGLDVPLHRISVVPRKS